MKTEAAAWTAAAAAKTAAKSAAKSAEAANLVAAVVFDCQENLAHPAHPPVTGWQQQNQKQNQHQQSTSLLAVDVY